MTDLAMLCKTQTRFSRRTQAMEKLNSLIKKNYYKVPPTLFQWLAGSRKVVESLFTPRNKLCSIYSRGKSVWPVERGQGVRGVVQHPG